MDTIEAGGLHSDDHELELVMFGKNCRDSTGEIFCAALSIRKRLPLDQVVLIEVNGGNHVRTGCDIYPDEQR